MSKPPNNDISNWKIQDYVWWANGKRIKTYLDMQGRFLYSDACKCGNKLRYRIKFINNYCCFSSLHNIVAFRVKSRAEIYVLYRFKCVGMCVYSYILAY